MHPNAPSCIRAHPNSSEQVQAGPSKSENLKNVEKTCENSRKLRETLAKIFAKACFDYNFAGSKDCSKPPISVLSTNAMTVRCISSFARRRLCLLSVPTIGGSRDRGVWHTYFGINYGSISFGQLSGYIVFCTVPIRRAKPPL